MPRAAALAAVSSYYDAFNRGDTSAMEALVTEDFEHHVNEGVIRRGGKSSANSTSIWRAATASIWPTSW